jgi:hypothetical protein
MVGPWEVLPAVQECPPSMLKISIVGTLAGADGDLGAPTINVKKC